ncbi:MAG: hypothetical protein ACUVSM_09970 [Armatimonadota bacterium]
MSTRNISEALPEYTLAMTFWPRGTPGRGGKVSQLLRPGSLRLRHAQQSSRRTGKRNTNVGGHRLPGISQAAMGVIQTFVEAVNNEFQLC